MKKIICFAMAILIAGQVSAIDFKVDGYKIRYKQSSCKRYNEFDYINFIGCTKGHLKSDGSPDWIFKDDSNIIKVIQDKLHCTLIIEKENSKWVLFYENLMYDINSPRYTIEMIEPDLETEEFIRSYRKQIFP